MKRLAALYGVEQAVSSASDNKVVRRPKYFHGAEKIPSSALDALPFLAYSPPGH